MIKIMKRECMIGLKSRMPRTIKDLFVTQLCNSKKRFSEENPDHKENCNIMRKYHCKSDSHDKQITMSWNSLS